MKSQWKILFLILCLAGASVVAPATGPKRETKRTALKTVSSVSDAATRNQRRVVQKDLPGTVSGKMNPSAIPDDIAYELFMRVLDKSGSDALARKAGLNADEAKSLLGTAKSFAGIVELDDKIHALAFGDGSLSRQSFAAQANDAQARRNQFVAQNRAVEIKYARGETSGKLAKLFSQVVKDQIKAIPVTAIQKGDPLKDDGTDLFGKKLYLYSGSWHENGYVYAISAVIGDYALAGQGEYELLTTIVSPSGKRYARESSAGDGTALVNVRAIPLEEDGEYTVEARLSAKGRESQSPLGYITNVEPVAPEVRLGPVLLDPTTFVNGGSVTAATLTVSVARTSGVMNGTRVDLEVSESGNQGNVLYSVLPNRVRTVSFDSAETQSQNVEFRLELNTMTNGSRAGTIVNRIQINGATNPLTNMPVSVGSPSSGEVTLTVSNPTTGGGGGGNGCIGPSFGYCPFGTGYNNGQCCYNSPILMDVEGDGFNLTDYYNGAPFDIGGDGRLEQLSWTAAGSDDSWLFLDRNGDGVVNNGMELFGNFTPQPPSDHPNGFLALAEYDLPGRGGDNDGRISPRDAIYNQLKLWCDRNHNGISEPGEMTTLRSHGIAIIRLNYHESRRVDQYGNRFAYRARIVDVNGAQAGRWAWDIFLVTNPAPTSP